jgi:hypothetical protein
MKCLREIRPNSNWDELKKDREKHGGIAMKITESLKIIDKGWVNKPKGFRVHFQKRVNSDWITDYVPGQKEKLLDSDVVAWRLAWKLSVAANPDNTEKSGEDIANIYVVDDSGNPIRYYRTNQLKIYNPTASEKIT